MRKTIIQLLTMILVFVLNGVAFGADSMYTVAPYDPDLADLEHQSAYSWEINITGSEYGYDSSLEDITKIELTFDNIYNWANEANQLFVSVLDSPGQWDADNLKDWDSTYKIVNGDIDSYGDTDPGFVNYFVETAAVDTSVGAVKELFSLSNLSTSETDITVTFDMTNNSVTIDGISTDSISANAAQDLFAWAQDGIFELGFDPDCHFYNDGVSLKIFTTDSSLPDATVPEPETLLLFGIGLIGVSAFGRKRMNVDDQTS